MATEMLLQRDGNRLCPAEPISAEILSGMKHGEIMRATIKRTRNGAHHRKFFVLVKTVFDAQDRYATEKALLNVLKMSVGHGDWLEVVKGKPIFVPDSISFARMDQPEFEIFYNKVVDVIVTKILPKTDKQDLINHVNDILEGNHAHIA